MTPPLELAEKSASGRLPLFTVPGWEARYGVRAGVTGRGEPAEPFDLGMGQGTPPPAARSRWNRLLAEFPEFQGLVVGRQVHGTRVAWHDAAEGVVLEPGTDGQATASAGILLAVTVADCIPVYLVDPRRRAAALLHAGWRGAGGRIVGEGLRLLTERAGCRREDVVMHCGIGICGSCYEVGPEVLDAFAIGRRSPSGKGHLDLRAVLARQADDLGVGTVSVSVRCSAHEPDLFFSHRAGRGSPERMAAYLGFTS